jgi:hypothetical protein
MTIDSIIFGAPLYFWIFVVVGLLIALRQVYNNMRGK